jgi:heat-inducible transcriptional repressor
MNDRESNILESVVNDYIDTGIAVSSKRIQQNYGFDISSATIRSELSKLETDGYLTHLHTSSGRVPSDKGYRFYVNNVIKGKLLPEKYNSNITSLYPEIKKDLDTVLKTTSQILADYTNCFCLVTAPDVQESIIKMIKVVLINIHQLIVVMLTNAGKSVDYSIDVEEDINEEDLNKITDLLKTKFVDKSYVDLTNIDAKTIANELPNYKNIVEKICKIVCSRDLSDKDSKRVFKKGTSNLVSYSDFNNIEELKLLVSFIDEEKSLLDLIATQKTISDNDVQFLIGSESNDNRLKNCTIAQATYEDKNHNKGNLCLVGPKRIKYGTVSSLLKTVSGSINEILQVK